MVTAIEYALLSLRVYRHVADELDGPIPSGWQMLQELRDDLTGFSAGAYRNTATGEIVIAYTGTNNDHGGVDWIANAAAGLGFASTRRADSLSVRRMVFCGQ